MSVVCVRDLIGKPYAVRGRGDNGYDCYGLAIEVLRRGGIDIYDAFYEDSSPEVNAKTIEVAKTRIKNERIDNPEYLCVVEFRVLGMPSHIGVYLGGGEFIHATRKNGVMIDKLARWKNSITGYYSVRDNDVKNNII